MLVSSCGPSTSDRIPDDRIRIERGPDGIRALDPERGVVHRILPADARGIASGHAHSLANHLRPEVLEGVVQAVARPRWDRRRVLHSSAALASAGISSVLLPSAAAASSVGGVAFGAGFASSFEATPTDLSDLSSTSGGGTAYASAYGQWVVPAGVSLIQIIATGTSGGLAGIGGTPSPSPYSGGVGSGAQAVGTFSVTPGHTLVVAFSGSQNRSSVAGGYGGSAAGVGDIGTGTSGSWLIVAGGGGGGGQGGVSSNTPTYANVAGLYTRDYRGGDGGDAGTGGGAAPGLTGSGADAGANVGTGGGGGTLVAGGAGGTGSAAGGGGGSSQGPTSAAGTTSLGVGGVHYQNTSAGGNGGGGLHGGGAGGSTFFNGSPGGGGGGSSYLRTARLAPGTPSEIELLNRAIASGPRVIIYY
jgi:hypothetical protein